MQEITLTRPDDWHLHLRDGASLPDTVAHSARTMGRAIIMPNLVPPVTTTADALAYRERILAHVPEGSPFQPLMTLYLTDNTPSDEIARARQSGHVYGVKLYPAGATTNSDQGVTNLENTYDTLEAMAEQDMPLLIHGEVTRGDVDIFDRERLFIDETLAPLHQRFPTLKMVFEHITTRDAADFVLSASDKVAATITPQHLMFNRNHMLVGGIRPHFFCLPILKRNVHQQALIAAATSGNPRFFLGTDSAPHSQTDKESACGCAGCYTAPHAMALYAEVFEQENRLDYLEGFASHAGADFYGLPRNTDTITLSRQPTEIPTTLSLGDQLVVPLRAGETLPWQHVA